MVRILDLRTRSLTPFFVRGTYPEWCPKGDVIAYQDYEVGVLRIIRPDGTGQRDLGSVFAVHSMAWSPDGDLLLGLTNSGLGLFQPSTGVLVPLPSSGSLSDMAWRPRP